MKIKLAYGIALLAVALFGAASWATTVSGGTPTIRLSQSVINQDGSENITLYYLDSAGAIVHARTLFIDSGCSKVVDNLGKTVSATGPTAVCNSASAYTTQLNTTIANAAAAGKLDL